MTAHDDANVILKRLERLEAENRRLKVCGTVLAVAIAAFVLMGQAVARPKVVEAERFVLKDSSGNIRGWMGLLKEGSELTLGNIDRQPMMTLQVSEKASDLHFQGQENSGMNLGVDFGVPAIAMAGSGGSGQAMLRVKDVGPTFGLRDSRGFSATVGVPETELNGTTKSDKRSAASVRLLDKGGNVLWSAPPK